MKLVGDWKKALTITQGMSGRFRKAARQAILKEAHFLRGEMVKGITSGAPGGQPFKELSALTLALRREAGFGGTKPLIRSGNLRRSPSVVEIGGTLAGGRVFVGVHRSAKTKDGKSLVKLAEIHEFGREWTQRLTPKARRFLWAMLHKYGERSGPGRDANGRFTKGQLNPRGGAGDGLARMKIPARPFVRPVVEKYAKPADVKRRFFTRLAQGMGYQLGGR